MCLSEPDINADDFYRVLGIKSNATEKEICAAYKRVALRYHPDKNPDDRDQAEHAFKCVTRAYETLRDPAQRRLYDISKEQPSQDFSVRHKCGSGNVGSHGADELYRMFLGGKYERNSSMEYPTIDLASIFNFDQQRKMSAAGRKNTSRSFALRVGTEVVVHGLETCIEHNGKSGRVHEWIAAKGRYTVSLARGGSLYVRPRNLTQLCAVTVRSSGQCGEIVDFNDGTKQYVVLMQEPPSVVHLSLGNCIFPPGTAATLHGLSTEELNGQMCTIVSIDHHAGRYVVECQSGKQLKARFENILC